MACLRIDFNDWLGLLPRRSRRIVALLALGERTGEVARRFGLTDARISQLRGEFCRSWDGFQGEPATARHAG